MMAKYSVRMVDGDHPVKYGDFEFAVDVDTKEVAWNIVDYLISEYRYHVGPVRFSSPPHVKRDLRAADLLSCHNIVAQSHCGELVVTIGPAG